MAQSYVVAEVIEQRSVSNGYMAFAKKDKAIWGIGDTVDQTGRDANYWQSHFRKESPLIIVPVTLGLRRHIRDVGGRIMWGIWNGVAMTEVEIRGAEEAVRKARRAVMLAEGMAILSKEREAAEACKSSRRGSRRKKQPTHAQVPA
jgi:hypothetical protein